MELEKKNGTEQHQIDQLKKKLKTLQIQLDALPTLSETKKDT